MKTYLCLSLHTYCRFRKWRVRNSWKGACLTMFDPCDTYPHKVLSSRAHHYENIPQNIPQNLPRHIPQNIPPKHTPIQPFWPRFIRKHPYYIYIYTYTCMYSGPNGVPIQVLWGPCITKFSQGTGWPRCQSL